MTAITRLGDSLNLSLTAEGIEDSRIEERMRALGCTKGQGFLFGQPLSVANTRRLLAERRLLQMPLPGIMALVSTDERRSA